MHRLIGLVLITVSVCLGWFWMTYDDAVDTPLLENTSVTFEIKPGDSLSVVAQNLTDQKIVRTTRWFKLMAILQGVSNSLKAGEYLIPTGVTARELLKMMVLGKVQQYTLTLVEGRTFRQVLESICQNESIFNTLCDLGDASIMALLGMPGEHPEGRFFPDTYFFIKGTKDIALLERAFWKMNRILEKEWENRAKSLPLSTPYEALILASIIEKETGKAEERPTIAGVFIRRLNKGMLLQTDPTVIYGLGESFNGNLRRKDLRQKTPYNTYLISGLPPTPIAMPSLESIRSALNPSHGKSLYFVARGDGSHQFSSTLADHNNAVNKYQRKRKRK